MDKIHPYVSSQLRKSIVLVGMMGSGKTTVGRALAAILGVSFLDSDAEIESAANMSIAEIFSRDGEAFFRRREREVILRLLQGPPAIVSTGGGAFLAPDNRGNIDQYGISVWLDADLDLLWSRVAHKGTRPLLRTDNPRQTLSDLYSQRTPIYAQARLRVCAARDLSVTDMARRVITALHSHTDVLEPAHA